MKKYFTVERVISYDTIMLHLSKIMLKKKVVHIKIMIYSWLNLTILVSTSMTLYNITPLIATMVNMLGHLNGIMTHSEHKTQRGTTIKNP